MGTWSGRGLRGSILEEMINMTNDRYRESGLALIQKIPTPIKPVRIDSKTKQITLGYFEKDSTVDYIGVVQGIPICFDAKECSKDEFSMNNIHEHQYEFMKMYEQQNGIAFILLYYSHLNEAYYVPFRDIQVFYERAHNGGLKHFKFNEIDKTYRINQKSGVPVHYLEMIQQDLINREDGLL